MASKRNIGKNTSSPNQPPLREVKDSATTSKKPLDFPTFEFFERYPLEIRSQSNPDLTYTSSPDTPDPHQDTSSNKALQVVTPKDTLYHIPNTKVD